MQQRQQDFIVSSTANPAGMQAVHAPVISSTPPPFFHIVWRVRALEPTFRGSVCAAVQALAPSHWIALRLIFSVLASYSSEPNALLIFYM